MSNKIFRNARQLPIRSLCRCYSGSDTHEASKHKVKRRIFSGIQPTGTPHIGNYLGAIQRWVKLQDEFDDVIFSVVDLHSITIPQDPNELRTNILEMTACLLAAGINPEKSILFQQSTVHQHAELSWILGCLTTMPRLEHLPQWKEKSNKLKESGLGLFTYPVLQSADILLYKATDVPVGDDQVKHIELTRHLANRFNKTFGNTFPKPNAMVGTYPRIRSLRDPKSKMSKSEQDDRGRLELTDSDDVIQNKVRKAVTDMTSAVTYDPTNRLGVSNLIELYAALKNCTAEDVVDLAKHMDTLAFKTNLADLAVEKVRPIREEIFRLREDKDYLNGVLRIGQDRAADIAAETLTEVKSKVGFV